MTTRPTFRTCRVHTAQQHDPSAHAQLHMSMALDAGLSLPQEVSRSLSEAEQVLGLFGHPSPSAPLQHHLHHCWLEQLLLVLRA